MNEHHTNMPRKPLNRIRRGGLLLIAGLLASSACDGDSGDKADGASQSGEATKQQGASKKPPPEAEPPKPPPSRRSELDSWRVLLDETPRAELRARGLLMDLGTVEGHKYTRAAWLNGWTAPKTGDDGVTYSGVVSGAVSLEFTPVDSDKAPAEIVVKMRSACKKARMTILLDGEAVGNADPTAEWGLVRIPFSEAPNLEVKPHELSLQVRGRCPKERAQVDWVWLAEAKGAEPPELIERQQPSKLGGTPRRAMVMPDQRTHSFFLEVPPEAELVFDHAAAKKGEHLSVQLTRDGAKTEKIWSGESEAKWQEAAVDLKKYAGEAVRLDFVSSGGAEAAFGEVELMVARSERFEPEATEPARNVVVILIDTIRADVFEPIGGEGSETDTPEFDKLTKEATVFTAAYDNENWTKPSVATVLSGLYPVTHDAKQQEDVLDKGVELLSQQLKDKGFKTGAFIANGYVSDKFGFKKGWDGWVNYIREGKNSRAEHVYDDAIEWLEKNKDDRFFLYVQTIDPHVPYRKHDETDRYYDGTYTGRIGDMLAGKEQADLSGSSKLSADDHKWIKALYQGEVTYHDKHMGRLIAKLRELGVMEDTLLVITNDHGEELNDHGKMGHGHSLYDELVHAPLLIRMPGRLPEGEIKNEPVESVDIAPTVLELLGIEPEQDHEGISLVPLMEGKPAQRPFYAVTEFLKYGRSIRVGKWKMIGSSRSWKKLFDISKDPGEQDNKIEAAPIARRMCEIHMTEALANPNKRFRQLKARTGRTFKSKNVEMDPELKKQLEALGYFHDD